MEAQACILNKYGIFLTDQGNSTVLSMDGYQRSLNNIDGRESVHYARPNVQNSDVTRMYAMPSNKQNQIGIPINVSQNTNKINMQKSSQITGNQNSSQSSLNQPKNNNDFTQVYIAYPLFYRI